MKYRQQSEDALYRALEAKGWRWEDERLYPPLKSFHLTGTKGHAPPLGTLLRMYEVMRHSLEALRRHRPEHVSEQRHTDWISDTESLVSTLEELLKESGLESYRTDRVI